jgi:hypothetical protein
MEMHFRRQDPISCGDANQLRPTLEAWCWLAYAVVDSLFPPPQPPKSPFSLLSRHSPTYNALLTLTVQQQLSFSEVEQESVNTLLQDYLDSAIEVLYSCLTGVRIPLIPALPRALARLSFVGRTET